MNRVFTWAIAALAAVAIAAAGNLDAPDDTQAAQDQSDALTELQASKPGTTRRYAAGIKVCAEHGRVAGWTAEGHLVCRLPAGSKEAAL